jgi:putative SOS response-associated peptidase YedK
MLGANIIRDVWSQWVRDHKLKYFVLKMEDWFAALTDNDLMLFNGMLQKVERYREGLGKSPNNDYWIVNRDEPYADLVKSLIFEKTYATCTLVLWDANDKVIEYVDREGTKR